MFLSNLSCKKVHQALMEFSHGYIRSYWLYMASPEKTKNPRKNDRNSPGDITLSTSGQAM